MITKYGHNPEDCCCEDCHTVLLEKIDELNTFIDKAFRAHPNLDLDIQAICGKED